MDLHSCLGEAFLTHPLPTQEARVPSLTPLLLLTGNQMHAEPAPSFSCQAGACTQSPKGCEGGCWGWAVVSRRVALFSLWLAAASPTRGLGVPMWEMGILC